MTVLRPLEFQNLPSREAMDAIFCVCLANVFFAIGIILYQAWDFGLSIGLGLKFLGTLSPSDDSDDGQRTR